MAEEDEVSEDELDALADAIGGGDENEGGEDLDPLAEEMLKMMEEEGDGDGGGSQEDVDRMMEMEMLKAMEDEGGGGGMDFSGGLPAVGNSASGGAAGIPANIARLMDVNMSVTIELGRTRQTLEEVLNLGEQSLVELDKQVGDPVDVLVNGKIFARGEVVTVSENFGVRITEIMGSVSEL